VPRADDLPILVVDDDESIRMVVTMALEDAGYDVVEATDGADALQVLERTRPRLVLLDMRMPRLNGWEFAASYRARPPPHVPIVVMSAGRDVAVKAADVGAVDAIGKPFDIDDLIAVVQRYGGPPAA
jgi:CheY-like chemotaxis protein